MALRTVTVVHRTNAKKLTIIDGVKSRIFEGLDEGINAHEVT